MKCPNGCGESIIDRKTIFNYGNDLNTGKPVPFHYVYPYICSKCYETFKKDELLP